MRGRGVHTSVAILLASLWAIGLGAAHLRGELGFLEGVEATLVNVRTLFLGQRKPPDLITIVAIDDEMVRQEGSYPVSRATLARIVDAIALLKPKVIALDILLVDTGPEDEDRKLAASLGGGKTVLAAAAVFEGERQRLPVDDGDPLAGIPSAERFLLPIKRFADVAAVGVVNLATDRTGSPRFAPMLYRAGNLLEASFPLRVASIAIGADPQLEPNRLLLGQRPVRTDFGYVLPLAFYGPRGTIRTIGASDVLAGRFKPEHIQDRIVVLGATVTGGGDVFPSPFDPVLPGVEVVATAIAHLMTGDGIVRDRHVRIADACIALILSMTMVALLAWRRSAVGLAAITGVVLFWICLNVVAFAQGIWLSATLPIAAAVPPAVLFGAAQILLGRRTAQFYERQSELLQRIEAPGLGRWLAEHPDFLNEPVQQDAAVMFIDLNGFTGLSERLGPEAVRDLLNSFHSSIDQEVSACGGAVVGFMGDGAMIVFGLPEASSADAFNAARCCARLSARTRQWIASQPPAAAATIGYKIGAHFGMVVASRLGSAERQHIAVAGDTVNVAQRLTEIAAAHHMDAAISDEFLTAAGSECALFKSGVVKGPVEKPIRGRSASIALWLWHDRQATPTNALNAPPRTNRDAPARG